MTLFTDPETGDDIDLDWHIEFECGAPYVVVDTAGPVGRSAEMDAAWCGWLLAEFVDVAYCGSGPNDPSGYFRGVG